jgi:hypothetical protein
MTPATCCQSYPGFMSIRFPTRNQIGQGLGTRTPGPMCTRGCRLQARGFQAALVKRCTGFLVVVSALTWGEQDMQDY